MENQKRCPECLAAPDVKEEKGTWIICCPPHGHIAMGSTLEVANKNWNIYVEFFKKTQAKGAL